MRTLLIPSILTIAAVSVTGCSLLPGSGDDENRVGGERITFIPPEGVTENTEYQQTDGWQKLYSDDAESPTITIRVSDDLGLTDSADSTLAGLRAQAMFNGTYGDGFTPQSVEKFEVDNSDVGGKQTFTATDSETGDEIKGTWFLVSNGKSDQVAGIEVMGTEVTDDTINEIGDSIEFEP